MKYSPTTGGFYTQVIHGSNIPADAIDITDKEYASLLAGQGEGREIKVNASGKPYNAALPIPDLASVVNAALAEIDRAAGATRCKYITDAPGQEATYLEKARQSEAYKAAGCPAVPDAVLYSYIIAECAARGGLITYQQSADVILAERDQWAVKGADIEQARRTAKIAISAATTISAVDAAKAAGLAALAAL